MVHPEGELDISTVPALCEEWLSTIDEHVPDSFVIDLAKVSFLDSSALAAIVAIRKRQRQHGGDLVVINVAPRLVEDLSHHRPRRRPHGQPAAQRCPRAKAGRTNPENGGRPRKAAL